MSSVQPSAEVVRAALAGDRFARHCGIEIAEVVPGYAVAMLRAGDEHQNAVGLVHGGALFTLAATAFFAACNAAGQTAVGIHMTLACTQAATGGLLRATAREQSRSRRVAQLTVDVADEDGRLLAVFQGTAYITPKPFPPATDESAAGR